jgi:hypothetical protein
MGKRMGVSKILKSPLFFGIAGLTIVLITLHYLFPHIVRFDFPGQREMRIVLDVDVPGYFAWEAREPDETYDGIIGEVRREHSLNPGDDIVGLIQKEFKNAHIPLNRYFGKSDQGDELVAADLREDLKKAIRLDSFALVSRLEQYGELERRVEQKGPGRFVVSFQKNYGKIYPPEEMRRLLEDKALCEFRIVESPMTAYGVMMRIDSVLASMGKVRAIDTILNSVERYEMNARLEDGGIRKYADPDLIYLTADSSFTEPPEERIRPIARVDAEVAETASSHLPRSDMASDDYPIKHPFWSMAFTVPHLFPGAAMIPAGYRKEIDTILRLKEVQDVIPKGWKFCWQIRGFTYPTGGRQLAILVLLSAPVEYPFVMVENALATTEGELKNNVVIMELNSDGAESWSRLTATHLGKKIAIVCDQNIFAAPYVVTKINGKTVRIGTMENPDDAKLLAIVLNASPLFAPLKIVSQEVIDAGK